MSFTNFGENLKSFVKSVLTDVEVLFPTHASHTTKDIVPEQSWSP